MRRVHAFTIVELLVVVATLVVLLALLIPAMDRAVYVAELARCGANLHAATGAGIMYTMNYKRAYPAAMFRRDIGYQPDMIGLRSNLAQERRDLRPIIRGYIELKLLLCPLAQKIDLSIEANDADTVVQSNYDVWYSWKYDGGAAMDRLGNRFSAVDSFYGTGNVYEYRLLVSDKNIVNNLTLETQSSHPDRLGLMLQTTSQNDTRNATLEMGNIAVGGRKLTQSRWGGGSNPPRGLLDLNFGFDDGSVLRLETVEVQDDRLRAAPAQVNDQAFDIEIMIPQ